MIILYEKMTIVTLWKKGCSQREISRQLACDRKTVRKVIREHEANGVCKLQKLVRPSNIEKHKDKIVVYLEQDLSSVRIREKLAEQGIALKYRTLCRYVEQLKQKENICVRFHSKPGEEGQVDFGYVGMHADELNRRRKAWVFNMRLSYSRLDYYEVVFDQRVKTFIMCHINAFRYFGGVPKIVRIDNLKSGILEASFYEPLEQETFRQFSVHYNFDIIACRVREPQEKGKVESGIKFVKGNFFAGRKFTTWDELKNALTSWLNTKCNGRVHGTTKRLPRELFDQEEKSTLTLLPVSDFVFPEIVQRKVCKDCHITVNNSYYSVPYEYVGKIVDIVQEDKLIKVSHESKQIAAHAVSKTPGTFVTNNSHYPRYKNFSHDSDEYMSLYEIKMKKLGIHGAKMFSLLLQEEPRHWYQISKGILSLSKQYSDKVVEQACQRALAFNITSYRKIKSICKSGSYNLPIT